MANKTAASENVKNRTASEQKEFERGKREAQSGDATSISRMVHESTVPGDHLSKSERAAYRAGVASVKSNK